MTLVESVDDVAALAPPDPEKLAFLTQTTLSVDDTRDMVAALRHRFPSIQGPRGEDICYATSNRQQAVKAIAPRCDRMIRSEEHTSELQSLMRISYAVFCLKNKKRLNNIENKK